MHFGHPGTLAALPGVLADLAARGLRPVTATTLLRVTTGTRVGTVRRSAVLVAAAVAAAAVVAALFRRRSARRPSTSSRAASPAAAGTPTSPPPQAAAAARLLPGMPPPLDAAATCTPPTGPGRPQPGRRAHARPLVYVPNTKSNDVHVIDPQTYKVVRARSHAGVRAAARRARPTT